MKIKACVETNQILAKGPYSPALKTNDFIFVSAQLPIDINTGKLVSSDISIQTRQCLENILCLLKETGLDLSYVVKTTVYLTDIEHYQKMNKVYETFFEDPYPACSTFEVKALPMGALVQIDCTAIDYRCLEVLCCEEECDDDGCCCI